jgi:tRNA1(Val) A37 N6-methylase TrmN6
MKPMASPWPREIPTGPGRSDPAAAGEGETLDHLAGNWKIYQLARGHRYSTDDVVTAWCALRARPDALRLLDLGAGTGALGLLTLLGLDPAARLVCVELQPRSAGLIERTAKLDGLVGRVEVRCADIRDPAALPAGERFDLIVSNPPYFPPGAAQASPCPERAAARLELRGDVFDFCRAAARVLAPGGALCLCHTAADPRPELAARAAGLNTEERLEVIAREGRAPLIAVRTMTAKAGPPAVAMITVRRRDGSHTGEYLELLRRMRIEGRSR